MTAKWCQVGGEINGLGFRETLVGIQAWCALPSAFGYINCVLKTMSYSDGNVDNSAQIIFLLSKIHVECKFSVIK